MLKGSSPVISPDLLKILSGMGHGDEIVISDAHFPAHKFGRDGNLPVLRTDSWNFVTGVSLAIAF